MLLLFYLIHKHDTFIEIRCLTVYATTIAQAFFCEGNSTLYFIYSHITLAKGDKWDGQTITYLEGKAVDITNSGSSAPVWNNSYLQRNVARIVFDPSFANVRPKSLFYWFYNYSALTTVEGIENLNTSETTYMADMFTYCGKLTTINVDGFDMSKVKSTSMMFYDCSSLTTIYCGRKWNVENSSYMFSGCTSLKGAVAYNYNKVDDSMANPDTGYFTRPN